MSRRLITLSSVLALAACSAGATPTSGETYPVASLESPIVSDVELDGGLAPLAPEFAVQEVKAPSPARLSCEIVTARTSNGLRITPVVRSDRRMSAEYSLVVTKDSAGGSSDISQGGPFKALGGDRLKLSSAEFSMERGARYSAVLKIREDGRVVCRKERHS